MNRFAVQRSKDHLESICCIEKYGLSWVDLLYRRVWANLGRSSVRMEEYEPA